MKAVGHVYLVGSGLMGFGLSHPFDCNVYLIDGGQDLALIDAGAGVEPEGILERVRGMGFDPRFIRFIFLTHAHADHAGGASRLRELSGAKVCLSTMEAAYLREANEAELGLDVAKRSGGYSADYRLQPCEVDVELQGGEVFTLGQLTITVIPTPGHSRGSVCYLVRGEQLPRGYLFSGDTVLECGRICLLNCRGASLDSYRESLAHLAEVDVAGVFPGHLCFNVHWGGQWLKQAAEYSRFITIPPNVA